MDRPTKKPINKQITFFIGYRLTTKGFIQKHLKHYSSMESYTKKIARFL